MDTLARYSRLYAYFVRFAFMRTFEFRFDFWIRIVMDCVYYVVTIAFFRILFFHTPDLGGWNEEQTLIFAAGYCLHDAINMTIFSNNLWWFPIYVNRGDLDYYLVRPVSSLFFLSLREFSASSFVNLLCSLALVIWAFARSSLHWNVGTVALFALLVFNGAFLFYCMNWLCSLVVFWSQSSKGVSETAWSLSKLASRPDRIYTGWIRRILTTALPYALMVSYPARLVIDGWNWRIFGHLVAVDAAIFGLLLFCWNRALRAYSSASS